MENNKIMKGIIHCAAKCTCNGCPYKEIRDAVDSIGDGYILCMQRLIIDIYDELKVEEE